MRCVSRILLPGILALKVLVSFSKAVAHGYGAIASGIAESMLVKWPHRVKFLTGTAGKIPTHKIQAAIFGLSIGYVLSVGKSQRLSLQRGIYPRDRSITED